MPVRAAQPPVLLGYIATAGIQIVSLPACLIVPAPSNLFNSAAVELTAVLPNVRPPSGTTILLPD